MARAGVAKVWSWRKKLTRGRVRLAVEVFTLAAVLWYANTARDQLMAAREQFECLNSHGKSQVRAYLLFESGDIKRKGAALYEAILTVKNSGVTPAYNVRHGVGTYIDRYPLPDGEAMLNRAASEPVNENQHADIGASVTLDLDEAKRRLITAGV